MLIIEGAESLLFSKFFIKIGQMAKVIKKAKLQFSLPLSILKEGKYFIAYSPALDLSTSGKTFEQAKERFNEVIKIFFEELLEKGTVDQVLSELGWQKIQREWTPPVIVYHEPENFQIPICV